MEKLTYMEAMGMNRKERRRLGKLNKTKIIGSSKPVVKEKN